ncbi:MAG: toxin-antitoxin system HicB family antitoxin [bacterium]|nr:toxin-antitoxin system HicB family antitoxin [bacterium]
MINFQVRLGETLHERLMQEAKEREISMADVIRSALETHIIEREKIAEGMKLFYEHPVTKERAEMLIPGFTIKITPRPKSKTTP